MDEKSNIYFTDTIGQKIIAYNGEEVQYYDVPFIDFARDLAVHNDKIFVLDDAGKVFILNTSGVPESEVKLPQGIRADKPGEALLWCANYIQYSLRKSHKMLTRQ